ncbi:glycosyltransferase [Halalkalibacter sp. AB-rgal2]|uniref:glycosyltransferase n=1 Tax=Halalkalibacter sp. AB-rgal2 TaxID=3242695 RepID=UPI00359EB65B
MKVVFAHDHIFKKDSEGNLYTTGSFNNKVWLRYLEYFEEVVVTARLDSKTIDKGKSYNNFDLEQTSFVNIPNLSGPLAQFKNKASAIEKLKSELSTADALIARLPSEIGNLAIQVAKSLNVPYVIEVVACVWDALWNYGSIQAKLYAPIAFWKMQNNIKRSLYSIYVTNSFLQTRYPTNGKSINISNVEIKEVEKSVLEKRLNKTRDNNQHFVIGMIGSLKNKIKGLDTALKAMQVLKNNNYNFTFRILGDGDNTEWLKVATELEVEESVEFCGVLPGGEPVFQWLDEVDIYIQPSYQEGLPRAIIEAMSRACPVVGSTAGGIPELIDKSCVHPPGDYTLLYEKVKNIIINQEYEQSLSEENYKNAKLYTKDILDIRRSQFFNEFLKCKKE